LRLTAPRATKSSESRYTSGPYLRHACSIGIRKRSLTNAGRARRHVPEAALDGEFVGENGVHVEADVGPAHTDLRGIHGEYSEKSAQVSEISSHLNHRATVLEQENRSSDADLGAAIGQRRVSIGRNTKFTNSKHSPRALKDIVNAGRSSLGEAEPGLDLLGLYRRRERVSGSGSTTGLPDRLTFRRWKSTLSSPSCGFDGT
jgi:hypothetical protein